MNVEAVVINWKRPQNISAIAKALKPQVARLTLIDASLEGFRVSAEVAAQFDLVFGIPNFGGINRYVPLLAYQSEFVYFGDDDMVPGPNCMKMFLECAAKHPDGDVFGQKGRKIGEVYSYADVAQDEENCVAVDAVVRGYFVRASLFPYLLRLKQAIAAPIREDDLLLALSARMRGTKVYLTRKTREKAEKMNEHELPSPHATSSSWNHVRLRTEFWHQNAKLADALRCA